MRERAGGRAEALTCPARRDSDVAACRPVHVHVHGMAPADSVARMRARVVGTRCRIRRMRRALATLSMHQGDGVVTVSRRGPAYVGSQAAAAANIMPLDILLMDKTGPDATTATGIRCAFSLNSLFSLSRWLYTGV